MTVARVRDSRCRFSHAERIGAASAPAAPRPHSAASTSQMLPPTATARTKTTWRPTSEASSQVGCSAPTSRGATRLTTRDTTSDTSVPASAIAVNHTTAPSNPATSGKRERLQHPNGPEPVEGLTGQAHHQGDQGDRPDHGTAVSHPHTLPSRPEQCRKVSRSAAGVRWKCSLGHDEQQHHRQKEQAGTRRRRPGRPGRAAPAHPRSACDDGEGEG